MNTATTPLDALVDAPILRAVGLHVRYGGRAVLQGLDLALPRASWVSVVGPNGAGKSTLLKALAHLLPYQGEVRLNARPMAQWSARSRAQQLAWLGQNEVADAQVIAWDAVMLGRLPHQAWLATPTAADRAFVEAALRATGAWGCRNRLLGQLSGGERQRVLLARALAVQAQVLLMDEPLANLDPPHQADWLRVVRSLTTQGKAVVSVLHELSMALRADQIVVLAQGRVLHQGASTSLATHRAIEQVFEQRIQIRAVDAQDTQAHWVALPVL
jgi:iron complex transport system ATP-binding protein